jgi:DHA1 family bicyclomycin/chloramphenicol resistance-like MFS transporter
MLLLKNKQFLLYAANLGLQVSIFYSFLNFLPFAFQTLGYSAAEFGAYIALLPVGFLVGNLLSRQLTPVFGITKMVRAGSTLTVLAVTLMAGLAFRGFHSALPLIAPAMIYSLSNGLTLPNATIGALIAAGRSAQGFGSGLAGSLQMLLGSTIATTTIFLGAAHDTRIGITVVLVVAISAFMTSLFLVDNAQER